MENQLVVFDVANEHYGVDISAVEAIIKLQAITAVPHAPAFVEGVTNLRGKVLPVLDLRRRFGLKANPATKETRIVVVEIPGVATERGSNRMTVGMIVDGVSEVLRVNDDSVEPPSPIVSTPESAFIKGIAKVGEKLVILLDLTKVLSVREHIELDTLPVAV